MEKLVILAKRILPTSVRNVVRPVYLMIRLKWRAAKRVRMRKVSLKDLRSDLSSAGICQGDIIMVHSSLSSVGHVDGGSETVIRSLMEVVTQNGTILMPTFGSAEEVQNDYKYGNIPDLRTKESYNGAITERFRTWPNVYRSSHPFSAVCAWGKNADYVTSGHADDIRICHPNSPMARLVELGGKVVGIGVSLGVVSMLHVIEDTWDRFPFKVYTDPFPVKYIDSSGNTVTRQVVRYDPVIAVTRKDHKDGEWNRDMYTKHLTRKDILRWFRFGNADSLVMETQPLCAELKRLAEKGITMYITRDEWKSMNGGDERIDSW